MNILILSGGTINSDFASDYVSNIKFDKVICADAGMRAAIQMEIIPDMIIGDFDSVDEDAYAYFKEKCPDSFKTYPSEKDETDTHLAIIEALAMGAKAITVLGATGTRLDHVLGNINLLKLTSAAGVDCQLVDEHNRIRMVRKSLMLLKSEKFGKYTSMLPFEKVTGLTLKGFKYPADDIDLDTGISLGVSNEIVDEAAFVRIESGLLLVMESRD